MIKHTPEFLAQYRGKNNKYGKCAGRVRSGWGDTFQCSRKNGHGPHGAWCKQHDPVASKARSDAASAKWNAEYEQNRRASDFARDCQAAIRDIAAGHNDPRALAQSVIDKLESKT